MAITKTVLKLTHNESYVKVTNDTAGAASVTIGLATDLLRSDETLVGSLDVRLSTVEYGLGAAGGNIKRNAIDVLEMAPNNHGTFSHDTCNDATQKNQDLVVTIDKGITIIRLLKVAGYQPVKRPEQGVN